MESAIYVCLCLLYYRRNSGREYSKLLNTITSKEEVGFGQSKVLWEMLLVFKLFNYNFKTKY